MEINFIALFKKYSWFIGGTVLAATVISAVIVYSSPDFYDASAKIYSKDPAVLEFLFELLRDNETANKKVIYDYSVSTIELRIRSENAKLSADTANKLAEEIVFFYPNLGHYKALLEASGADKALELLPQIVKVAAIPERPAGPARLPIVAATALIGFAGAILLAGIREWLVN